MDHLSRSRPRVGTPPRAALTAALALALVVLVTGCLPLVEPPTSGRTFGQGPLEAVSDAASAQASCGLSSIELAAMMMAPTYTEAGGPVPPPMALSRWDNLSVNASNRNLFAFGQTTGPYVNAFFSPGIGMWQFDSAGGWPFSAAGAIDSVTASNQAAATMSYRWCNAPTAQRTTPTQRRKYAWGPWYGCSTTNACEDIYVSLVAGDRLNTGYDTSVTRYGGMQQRTCNVAGIGEGLTCWYVDPARAEGSRGWTLGSYGGGTTGVTPLPKPFYVVEAGGREYRIWLPADTGYDIGITASKPIAANARTSLTWAATAELCDVSASRGTCVGGNYPIGHLDVYGPAGPERLRVAGWTIDQDTVGPIQVRVEVDGRSAGTLTADAARADVGAAYPGYGDRHGYDGTVAATAGSHRVCTYGVNVGRGADSLLGCGTVSVTGFPTGALDLVAAAPGRIDLQGWVAVPGMSDATAVISLDGVEVLQLARNRSRPDVMAVLASAGPSAGFAGSIAASGGPHQVCLTAGGAPLGHAACRSVVVPSGPPIGALDVVAVGPGSVTVAGWAIDPDSAGAIEVHAYVGGSPHTFIADGSRPDVGGAFPGYGAAHGYTATLPTPGGRLTVCTYGINVGVGSNALLGCRTVTVPAGSPVGAVDLATRTLDGRILVQGWALDPDTPASIAVHVYVGASGIAITAAESRPDVAAAYPGYGAAHGWSALVAAPPGPVSVCAYAINAAGPGGNPVLACRTV